MENDPGRPYTPPSARVADRNDESIDLWIYMAAILAAVLSVWYLGLDGRKWFDPNYIAHLSGAETAREWTTRFFYAAPKLGVILGAISLFKYRRYSWRIYLGSWLFAMAHSAMYYGAYSVIVIGQSEELLRLAVHHVVPHAFFVIMTVALYRYTKAADQSPKQTPKAAA